MTCSPLPNVLPMSQGRRLEAMALWGLIVSAACSSSSVNGVRGGTGTAGGAGTSAGSGGSSDAADAASSSGTAGAAGEAGADATALDGPLAVGVRGHPDPTQLYPTYDGFTLYLVEEFNQPLDLDQDPIWTWGDGMIGQACFVEDRITFADGKMQITVAATDAPDGGAAPACPLQSGELRSKHNMFRYGRYEASIKAPNVDGNYILSLFTFRTAIDQEWREIDFELLGSLPTSLSTNIIIADNPAGWSPFIEEPASAYPFGASPAMALPDGYGPREDFHTYAFEALPDHITWFVDGVPVRTKQTGVGTNSLNVPSRSMKVMFNHWVFQDTGFGGDPSRNVYPFTGQYDWFRFYKWNQDDRYPCEPVPGCLDPMDADQFANNPKELPDRAALAPTNRTPTRRFPL
jgi:endo-1,3-1,4-beta-glycanase ExoK